MYCGLCKSFSTDIAFHSPPQLHIAFPGCIIPVDFLEALNLVDCAPLPPPPPTTNCLLWHRKTGGGWDGSNSLLLAVIRLWKDPFPCRILLWRRLRIDFTVVTFLFSLPEPRGDLYWISPWQSDKVPGDKVHESVAGLLRLALQEFLTLMLIHTQPPAVPRSYYLHVPTSYGSVNFFSR